MYLYTSEDWKKKVLENLDSNLKDLFALVNVDKERIVKFYKLAKKRYKVKTKIEIDEEGVLRKWKDVLENKTGLKIKINPNEDPLNKKENAIPLKPSLYLF